MDVEVADLIYKPAKLTTSKNGQRLTSQARKYAVSHLVAS